MEKNNRILLAVRWSVKNFFAPNSPIYQKNRREEEEDGENRQIQSVSFFRQTQLLLLNLF